MQCLTGLIYSGSSSRTSRTTFSPIINLKTSVININNNKILSNSKKRAKNKKLKPKQLYGKKQNRNISKAKNKFIINDILNMK